MAQKSMELEIIYCKLPGFIQNLVCSFEGWRIQRRRYGAKYREIYLEVERRSREAPKLVEGLKKERLASHLKAAAYSPFWSHEFKRYGIQIKTMTPEIELEKLPIFTKSTVQDQSTRIINSSIDRSELIRCHTSGTTGAGLNFYETQAAEKEQWAVWWRYRGWHGISHKMWCAYFGGRSVVPLAQARPPYWRLNYPGRQIFFSGYHLSTSTAPDYLTALEKYSPPWLHGYPSLLSLVASYLLERGRPLRNPPRIVTTGSENLLPQQRDLMTKAFGCPIRQHYGQAEAVANISECPLGHLHIDEDFSFVELIPLDHQPGVYRLIGTNWSNPAFPLLRYDTGDLVRYSGNTPPCNITGRVVDSIDGRKEDYVFLPSGIQLGRLDHIFKDLTQIREAQIFQPDRETIILRVVKREGYSLDSERRLLKEARKRLGDNVVIKVEYHSALERGRTGKLRFVVSEV